MTYFSNSMLHGSFFLFLTFATCNLYSALPQPEAGLKRSKNFNIKHSENELSDLIEAARLEKNDAILGYSLYEYGCNSEFIKNISIEMARNNVPPQNVFAIMQAYTSCIDDDNLSLIILSSFIDHVLQQSVIDGNLNYVIYLLNIPECEKLIFSESITKALKNLKSCDNIHVYKTIEISLHNYLKQHLRVVLNFCVRLMPATAN